MRLSLSLLLCGLLASLLLADDVYLKDGSIFRNVRVVDTVGTNIRCLRSAGLAYQTIPLSSVARIDFKTFDPSKPSPYEEPGAMLLTVRTLTGDRFEGTFRTSDSATVTYTTKDGYRIVNRAHILSVEQAITRADSRKSSPTKLVTVREYENLWVAVPAIAGAIWSFTSFSKASDLRDGIDAAKALGLGAYTGQAETEASEKETIGVLTAIGSLALFIVAFDATETTIEQPVSLVPTSNGVTLSLRF